MTGDWFVPSCQIRDASASLHQSFPLADADQVPALRDEMVIAPPRSRSEPGWDIPPLPVESHERPSVRHSSCTRHNDRIIVLVDHRPGTAQNAQEGLTGDSMMLEDERPMQCGPK